MVEGGGIVYLDHGEFGDLRLAVHPKRDPPSLKKKLIYLRNQEIRKNLIFYFG